ncbi:MAG: flagellar basal body rod protein FlgC [Bdellovibrionia bacterium]|jgi:flagellar basal-body rod protein FlgC
MDLFSSMRVSATGLDAQTKRMNTISSNLANAETVGYHKKEPMMAAETDRESFGEILQNELDENVQGVRVQEIIEDPGVRMVYNPNHPQANAEGYVAMPKVNTVEEMANMISAQRSYEANVTAMNAAKQMAQKALEIGR